MMCNWKKMEALYFKLFFLHFKFFSYEYFFGLTWDKNLEENLPEFRNHRKNLIDIKYSFELFTISVDFLITGFTKGVLSFIHKQLAAEWFKKGGLADFAAAVEQLYL